MSVGAWLTRFAASTHPILLRVCPNRKRFTRHCLGCNVTVCALLSFTGSWVRSLPCFHYSTATVDRTTQRREALLSHARTRHTHLSHIHESKACCSKFVPRTIKNLCDPNSGLKSLVLQDGITAQMGVRLFVTATAKMSPIQSSRTAHCQPA